MKSEGGRATVTLSLDLGHGHDQRQQFHRSRNGPARQRRREKRAASRSEKEHNTVEQPQADAEIAITDVEETSDSVEAEKASEKVVESVEENIPIEETEESFTCILCNFTSKWKTGLAIHMTRKHCNLEQLDGTTDETDEDEKYERSCHYWKNGRIVIAYQTYLEVLEIIESSDLDTSEKEIEKHKVTEACKEVFGPNYKNFPPWK